ncbi:uncharacterized protein LOC143677399 isoform X1 [Tamandua tetradactyla]|uniref:uncharacterized protein LOC143677399 isoform X1 n=2 Tax=Tamandua tetradactyla TaxID=48850 RepID=UPI004053A1F9
MRKLKRCGSRTQLSLCVQRDSRLGVGREALSSSKDMGNLNCCSRAHRVAPLEEEPNAEVAVETSLNSEVASRTPEKAPLEDLAEEAPRDRAAEDAASNDEVTLNANDKAPQDQLMVAVPRNQGDDETSYNDKVATETSEIANTEGPMEKPLIDTSDKDIPSSSKVVTEESENALSKEQVEELLPDQGIEQTPSTSQVTPRVNNGGNEERDMVKEASIPAWLSDQNYDWTSSEDEDEAGCRTSLTVLVHSEAHLTDLEEFERDDNDNVQLSTPFDEEEPLASKSPALEGKLDMMGEGKQQEETEMSVTNEVTGEATMQQEHGDRERK